MARTAHAHARKHAEESNTESARSHASAGAGRGIWNGSISFGLLQIPISLHAAESRVEELHFRLLDKKTLTPIKNERVSSATGKKVDWKDIVKGYEIEKDNFVIVDPEDFAKANVKATQTIDIQDFVPKDQIDPAFFETPYFVIPQKRATKAYVLLRDALAKKNAVAIATFVLRTREHLVALMPVGDAIMLEVLRFGHELKDAGDLPLPSSADAKAISEKELKMAEQLIDGMMNDFDPTKYKDHFYRDVMKIIDEKAKTGVATEHHTPTKGIIAHDDVIDLLDILKKSVAKNGHGVGEHANDDQDSSPRPRRRHPPAKARPHQTRRRIAS